MPSPTPASVDVVHARRAEKEGWDEDGASMQGRESNEKEGTERHVLPAMISAAMSETATPRLCELCIKKPLPTEGRTSVRTRSVSALARSFHRSANAAAGSWCKAVDVKSGRVQPLPQHIHPL